MHIDISYAYMHIDISYTYIIYFGKILPRKTTSITTGEICKKEK